MSVNNLPTVATQWNSGATRDSNSGRRVLIPSALTTTPPSHIYIHYQCVVNKITTRNTKTYFPAVVVVVVMTSPSAGAYMGGEGAKQMPRHCCDCSIWQLWHNAATVIPNESEIANRLVTIVLPLTVFVDVDTDLTFLAGMLPPFEDEELVNDVNLQTKT